jgi:hypothetical protein
VGVAVGMVCEIAVFLIPLALGECGGMGCEFQMSLVLKGRMNWPEVIRSNTERGTRNPYSLIMIVPSAVLTSDSVQMVEFDCT